MATYYELTFSREDLKKYLGLLDPNDKHIVVLQAREKYVKTKKGKLKGDPHLVKSTLSPNEIEDFVGRLECRKGLYKVDGVEVPEEALCVYIQTNPQKRDKSWVGRAVLGLVYEMMESGNYNKFYPSFKGLFQKNIESVFMDFDIDFKEGQKSNSNMEEILNFVRDKILVGCKEGKDWFAVETNGGMHIVIKNEAAKEKSVNKSWYQSMSSLKVVFPDWLSESKGMSNGFIPLVGCTHGGFVPRFVGSYSLPF